MRTWFALLAWAAPMAIYSGDALAWGLYTHVYFAQLLIWAIPLADSRFRRAVQRFPALLLAGACLPDTALFSRCPGAHELGTTHQWPAMQRMLAGARDDESRALVTGYASHLLADVIAHNHFVPAHERLWLDYPVVTHAASEWAMDAHLAPHLLAYPGELLCRHGARLARQAAAHFDCSTAAAARALRLLANGERILRGSGVPRALRRGVAALDRRVTRRFDYYVNETAQRMRQIDRLLAGDAPAWKAEPETPRAASSKPRPVPMQRLGYPLPLPPELS
jgi:hypothetical protein